jgi:hypothetical protein
MTATRRHQETGRHSLPGQDATSPATITGSATRGTRPAYPTKLEQFLKSRDIKPAHVARESGYSRQHLLRIRMGRMEPTRRCIAALVAACRHLSREAVQAQTLFDLGDAVSAGSMAPKGLAASETPKASPAADPKSERIWMSRSLNARVTPRPERFRPEPRLRDRNAPRFGAKQATALLILELGAAKPLDDWDIEWFEAEFLRQLRVRLFAIDSFDRPFRSSFDGHANIFDYAAIDLDCVLVFGKRRYYELLFAVLRSLYEEEGVTGEITDSVLRHYRIARTTVMPDRAAP